MSYTYLQEQGEVSSAASFSDIPQSVLSRLNLTAGKSYSKDNETASCQSSQFGTMSPPSSELRGKEKSMSSAEGSPAKISQQQEKEPESQGTEADCGEKWHGSLAKFDPATSLWRTRQCLLFEDSAECLAIFPRWGIMRAGELWEVTPPDVVTNANECGLLGTPLARMWKNRYWFNRKNPMGNLDELPAMHPQIYGNLAGKQMSLTWLEHHMIFPLGWTDQRPLETGRFQQWLHSHGESSALKNELNT